ncbi:universal stress protein [Pedobacter sp. BG31]|uniref:universal stress protein n=1 Tax=Pedobacter sp. BG31 TaxID=3349697 RepID=UPI0035F2592B
MNSKKKASTKMILMLTEFSNRDKNATDAALKLAVKLGLNLMLLHVYPVTGNEQSKNQMENAKYLSEIDRYFESEKKRLMQLLQINQGDVSQPMIKSRSVEGSLSDNVCGILEKEDIVMIVMGGRPARDNDYLFCTEIDEILYKTSRPVLIIPEKMGLEI